MEFMRKNAVVVNLIIGLFLFNFIWSDLASAIDTAPAIPPQVMEVLRQAQLKTTGSANTGASDKSVEGNTNKLDSTGGGKTTTLVQPASVEKATTLPDNQASTEKTTPNQEESKPAPSNDPASPTGAKLGTAPGPAKPELATENASLIEKQYRGRYSSSLGINLTQFGYNIFSKAKAKTSNLALPNDDYRIGPGDKLRIRVWGSGVDSQFVGEVEKNGTINVPQIGIIDVSDVSYGQVEQIIRKESEKYIRGSNVNVTLVDMRSVEVYVVGSVISPTLHLVPAFSTVFDALLSAGGVSKSGSLRNIEVYRNGQLFKRFDLYDLLLHGKRDADLVLENRDVIFVPRLGETIAVAGAVSESAIFELNGEKNVTECLLMAGGMLPQSYAGRLHLRRYENNHEFVVRDIETERNPKAMATMTIQNGDMIELAFLPEKMPQIVELEGHVWQPDVYQYKTGMTINEVLTSDKILKPGAVTGFAILFRYDEKSTRTTEIRIPLMEVFQKKFTLPLQPHDRIKILAREELGIAEDVGSPGSTWKPGILQFSPGLDLITLEGHVWQPDVFQYKPGMTIADVLISDRILKPGAVTDLAILYRYDPETTRTTEQQIAMQEVFQGKFNMPLQPHDRIKVLSRAEFGIDEDLQRPGAAWKSEELEFTPGLNLVTLEGHVWQPDVFQYKPGMTVADILTSERMLKPNAITDFALLYRYDPQTTQSAAQRISLTKVFKGEMTIPLQPYDRIKILARNDFGIKEEITVSGAVWKPGALPYTPGLTLAGAIALAGGDRFGAQLSMIELSRQSLANGEATTKVFILDFNKNSAFPLLASDYIKVKEVKEANSSHTVHIQGEVRYPGDYKLADGERLSSLIHRAGGFLPSAYYYGAKFTSQRAQVIQQKSIDDMVARLEMKTMETLNTDIQNNKDAAAAVTLAQDAKQKTINTLKAVKAEGRVSIQLADEQTFTGSAYDFVMDDADTLVVPKQPNFVSVIGSVYGPNSFHYEPSRTIEYYLKKSGGGNKEADKKAAYLMKANGEIISKEQQGGMLAWSSFESQTLMPGDTIVMPMDFERVPYLGLIKDLSDIVFKIATTAGIAIAVLP